ncbi:squamosa promoter-binding 15 isoform B [Micractinium conductrix]|uniref:Squamosa promoter-binding 15 isoform B n=1 Tax=Micractinium conductrix TaxID=554055 RepID=A0A2P6VLU0_9CHLO|nr:squamosa promoter-binding 15 isoform B [Micractinium conductrix]|eukprot:PSC75071.1 squamosa promoter-binding 15 isoform B [Micractinium conductrix]
MSATAAQQDSCKMHTLVAFDGDKRSCTVSLQKRKARRHAVTFGGGAATLSAAERPQRKARLRKLKGAGNDEEERGAGTPDGSAAGSSPEDASLAQAVGAKLRRTALECGGVPASSAQPAHTAHPLPAHADDPSLLRGMPGAVANGGGFGGTALPTPPGSGTLLHRHYGRTAALHGPPLHVAPAPLPPPGGCALPPGWPAQQRLAAQQQHAAGQAYGAALDAGDLELAELDAADLDLLLALEPEELADALLMGITPQCSVPAQPSSSGDAAPTRLCSPSQQHHHSPAPLQGYTSSVVLSTGSGGSGDSAYGRSDQLLAGMPAGSTHAASGAASPSQLGGKGSGSARTPPLYTAASVHAPQQLAAVQPRALHARSPPQAAAPPVGLEPWTRKECLVDLSLKLFGATPADLPTSLRDELASALQLAPTVMLSSIRTDTVCLSTSPLASRPELEALGGVSGGVAGVVVGAVARVQAAAGRPAKVLCQAGASVSAADSSALAHSTLPALPPLRVASPPVALAGGGPLQAVLVGWGIAGAGTTLHCRSRGHTVVLTVLQARRGGGGDDGDEELDEPGTPSTTENPSLAAPSSSDGGSRSRGPAPLDARGAPPSQAALLLERVELAGGEDAVVVTLPAALAWGLVEFEAAQGALLSTSAPLLVLPRQASAAARELRDQLAAAAAAGGWSDASLLRHLGFLLHAAQRHSHPGAAGLETAAAHRLHRLARHLAVFCMQQGWPATAALLLPALAVRAGGGGGSARGAERTVSKDEDAPLGVDSIRAAQEAATDAGVVGKETEQLEALLAGLAAQQQQQWGEERDGDDDPARGDDAAADEEAALLGGEQRRGVPAGNWLWAGVNLAATVAGLLLVYRTAWM